jgi:hypothetical protein
MLQYAVTATTNGNQPSFEVQLNNRYKFHRYLALRSYAKDQPVNPTQEDHPFIPRITQSP